MATKQARAKSILTALGDAEPDQAKIDRILNAFALAVAPTEAATMTTAEKLTTFLRATRTFVRETVQGTEIRQAQEQARLTITPPDLGND